MTSGVQFFPLQSGQISLQETSSPNLGEYIPFVLKIHDYKHHETWNVTVPSLANVRRWNTFLLYSFLLTQYPSSPSLSLAPFLNPLDGSGTTWHSSTTGALTTRRFASQLTTAARSNTGLCQQKTVNRETGSTGTYLASFSDFEIPNSSLLISNDWRCCKRV